MTLFYAPDIEKSNFLSEEESQHCVRVLRLKNGDEIHLIDGRGTLFRAEIVSANAKKTEFRIVEATENFEKRPFRLHLAIAPTKNIDRFEWFVEKATEIGFDELTPLVCRYSERKVVKTERLEKIVVAAAKQSLKAAVPTINPLCTFADFMKKELPTNGYIAHCYQMPKEPLLSVCKKNDDVVVLVGPEGDFSREEVELALQKGFQAVSLGKSRLRTETAALVACHTVTVVNS